MIVRQSILPAQGLRKLIAPLMLSLMLAACGGQEIYKGLTEREANDMVAVLKTSGIEASKAAGDKEGWGVEVASSQFSRAVEVLRVNGLPREQFDTLGTVFKKEGFTSSPLAERARLIYGLSQELSHTISEIDGVVQARVHLTMPEADPLSRAVQPSAASVFVKYRPGFDLRNQTGAIKSLVTNSIEGLTYDRVNVVMVAAKAIPAPVAASSTGAILAVLGSLAAFAGLTMLGWLGYLTLRRRGRLSTSNILPVDAPR